MKVFLDTNFVMDLFGREPDPTTGRNKYEEDAVEVINIGIINEIEFNVSFLSVANFAYLLRKTATDLLHKQIEELCNLFKIVSNTSDHLVKALKTEFKDYEDAVQYETALSSGCEIIITRNKKHFSSSLIPALTPEEFIKMMN